MMAVPLIVFLTLLLSGCGVSHGFNRDAMRAVLQHEAVAVNDPVPDSAAGKRIVPIPFRLGLFFVHKDFPPNGVVQKADWVTADKQGLMTLLAPLHDERIASEIFLLEDATIKGRDASRIRQAGRRYGADLVLIVDGVGAVDRFNNGSAWLYATLIGAYLASGTESDTLFMIEGSLWDVRTERLYAIQQAEGTSKQIGPAMSVEDHTVLRQAKHAALNLFGQRMADQFRRLIEPAPRPSDGLR